MKNRRFWPEQIEEARMLAIQEKKLLTREYDAILDADGLRILTHAEYDDLRSNYYSNAICGWIIISEDYTEGVEERTA